MEKIANVIIDDEDSTLDTVIALLGGLAEYDPSQPRDGGGRWTSGGGGGGGGRDYLTSPGKDVTSITKDFFVQGLPGGLNPSGGQVSAQIAMASYIKAEIVHNIGVESSLKGQEVDDMIRCWASTSNDNSPNALQMQKVSSEEFDSPLSKFQQDRIEMLKNMGYKSDYSDTTSRAFVKAVYNETQRRLEAAGIGPDDEVILYRGIGAEARRLARGKQYVTGNALESYSLDPAVARSFAEGKGAVLKISVPRRHIFSTARTGTGCLAEREFVILGGYPHRLLEYSEQ